MDYDIAKYMGVEYRALWWLMLASFFLVLELGNPGLFFFLSFCVGSLMGMATSLLGIESLIVQIGIAFGSSFLAGIALQLWLKRAAHHGKKTNSEALVGKSGIIIRPIAVESPGLVKIGGEVWSARAQHGVEIAAGTSIKVIAVSGAHLIVTHS